MIKKRFAFPFIVSLLDSEGSGAADETPLSPLSEVKYSSKLAAAGHPRGAELGAISAEEFQRIVFLAFNDHKNALRNEDRIVENVGHGFFSYICAVGCSIS